MCTQSGSGRLVSYLESEFNIPFKFDIVAEFCRGSASVPRGFVLQFPEAIGDMSCDRDPVVIDSKNYSSTECNETV